MLLYAELRSRVAPCYHLYSTLLLLDETTCYDVRTMLNLLLPLLAPARIMKFQRWYMSFTRHRALLRATVREILPTP